ncbi:MAG: MarR family transcriptional regulator [Acidimicrobiales bacterium]
MQASEVGEEAVDALVVASRVLVGVAAASLADAQGVTLPQFRALVVLASRPGLTVTELGDALGIHSSTATRLCDRLVAKKLVRRAHRAEDRRVVELRLAAGGRRLVEAVTARRRAAIRSNAARLPPSVLDSTVASLQAFAEAAGEPAGDDLFGWQLVTAVER